MDTLPVDSFQHFTVHIKILHFIGIYFPHNNRIIFVIFSIVLNIIVTACYPITLVIGLFQLTDMRDILENLSLTFTIISCSIKIMIFALLRNEVYRIKYIISQLDKEIKDIDERTSIKETMKTMRRISIGYSTLYFFIIFMAGVGMFFFTERRLIYPAWFPFDWKNSAHIHRLLLFYQIGGLSFQGFQNFISDSAPPVLLCLLSGHLRVLTLRIKKVGKDTTMNPEEHYCQLIKRILEHKLVLGFYEQLRTLLSPGMFIQMLVTAFNICISIVTLLFVVNDVFHRIYFSSYIIAILMEVYLACYYGTSIREQSANLTNAIYSMNWVDQNKQFRKAMITFMERTKRPIVMVAGGFAKIDLETFLSIMKSSFSLFAVLLRLKPN